MITINAGEYVRQLNRPNQVHPVPTTPIQHPTKPEATPRPARWPRWMKKAEIAEYLSVSERTIDKWIKTALLPKPMIFSTHLKRWDRLALDEHLDQKTSITAAEGKSVSNLLNTYAENARGANNAQTP